MFGPEADMRRRDLIAFVGGGAAAWPLLALAQSPKQVIGFLGTASPAQHAEQMLALHLGLKHEGFVEGHNLTIEYRWANDRYERLPSLAADLVRRNVDVIAAHGPGLLPAMAATTTIPVVFFTGVDPGCDGDCRDPQSTERQSDRCEHVECRAHTKRMELAPITASMGVMLTP
jgi:hypothetical protein